MYSRSDIEKSIVNLKSMVRYHKEQSLEALDIKNREREKIKYFETNQRISELEEMLKTL